MTTNSTLSKCGIHSAEQDVFPHSQKLFVCFDHVSEMGNQLSTVGMDGYSMLHASRTATYSNCL